MSLSSLARRGATAVVVAATLAFAGPSQAAVHYLFELIGGTGELFGSFLYTSADFVTVDRIVDPGDLDACSPLATGTCGAQEFHVDSTGFISGQGDINDIIGFKTEFGVTGSTSFHYFANGAFGAVGVYNAGVLNGDASRLTVTGQRDVPEPGVWSLMLLGFGAIGAMIRRRARDGVAA